jgi:hypothetical protein
MIGSAQPAEALSAWLFVFLLFGARETNAFLVGKLRQHAKHHAAVVRRQHLDIVHELVDELSRVVRGSDLHAGTWHKGEEVVHGCAFLVQGS